MRAFHQLVGRDDDADDLLLSALGQARYRVVVKRPRKAPLLAQREPSYQLSGKTTRFDVYAQRKLPEQWPEPAASKTVCTAESRGLLIQSLQAQRQIDGSAVFG